MKNHTVHHKFLKLIFKYIILFLFFGFFYFGIECLWRKKLADWRMGVMGGTIAVIIGMMNNLFSDDTSFLFQCLFGSILTTLAEAILGTHWQQKGIHIWDYSALPFSYVNGNINLFFSIAWFFLSGLCIFLDDFIRHLFFHEKMPRYKLR